MLKNLLFSMFLSLFWLGVAKSQIVINEIFYNAPNIGPDTIEYIELYNNSTSAINLQGYHFSQGVNYVFPSMMIDAGEYVVVTNDSIDLMNILGVAARQWFTGGLNNSGEDIQLNDADSMLVDYVDYMDGGLWPSLADGDGYSMELCDPNVDNNTPGHWQASATNTGIVIESIPIYGSPGAANNVGCPGIITVNDNFFAPTDITIFVGETITWINNGNGFHNVNGTEATFPGNDPEFFYSGDPSNLDWSYSYTFNTPGTYDFQCDVHPITMTGTVTVLPAPSEDIVINEIMYNPPGTDALGEYLELYNRGSADVNLQGFSFSEGIDYVFPDISLAPGEFLVLAADSAAVQATYGISARQWTLGGLSNNGEDIVLLDNMGNIIDIVVYDNNAPWAAIADGEGPSLILCDPNSDNSDPANWRYSVESTGIVPAGSLDLIFASPGMANNCPTEAHIFFNGISGEVNEGAGLGLFSVRMAAITATDSADVTLVTLGISTATDGIDYSLLNTNLHFPPTTAGNVSEVNIEMGLIDDTDIEGDETVVLELDNAMGATIATTGQFTVTIKDNDGINYPTYPIGTVSTVDANGVADSLDVTCSLTGVVHGVNLRPSGLQFTIIDANNDGIGVFNLTGNLGYTVAEGDLVTVQGVIAQFNGLTQIEPVSVMMISQNNPLWNPSIVTALDETTESQMVRFNNMTIVDPTDWTNSGTGFNVDITDGTNTVTMRIDNDVDIYGTSPPTGNFDVIGIGGQFDSSEPHLSGYQFLPRYLPDIIPDPFLNAINDDITIDINQTVAIEVLNNDNLPQDVQSVTIITPPSFGNAVVNGDFSITYTPDLDFCGQDAFSYEVCDVVNDCDTAFVSVTVNCPSEYPLYEIGDVTTVDANGLPDSIDVTCELRGIVYGVNLRAGAGGLQFTIIDPDNFEDGISVFNSSGNYGYTVTEGDLVACQGSIGHFNGLGQIYLDSVFVVSTGNALEDPQPTTVLDESTESKLVKLFNVTIVDPTDWTGTGQGFNVDVTDGTSVWEVRIDNDVDLYSQPAPTGLLNITGIGSQFDSSEPHTDGYQLLPRYAPDIEEVISTSEVDLQQQVHVFPNPVKDVLYVGAEVLLDEIVMFDKLGRLVYAHSEISHNNAISVEGLAPGVYILRFRKNGHRWAEKFVKQ